jgi:hypothetical protein
VKSWFTIKGGLTEIWKRKFEVFVGGLPTPAELQASAFAAVMQLTFLM